MQLQRREKGKNEGRAERANGTKEKRDGSLFTVEMGKGIEKKARNFNCYQETRRGQHMRSVVRVRIWPDLRATAPLRWCLFLLLAPLENWPYGIEEILDSREDTGILLCRRTPTILFMLLSVKCRPLAITCSYKRNSWTTVSGHSSTM